MGIYNGKPKTAPQTMFQAIWANSRHPAIISAQKELKAFTAF